MPELIVPRNAKCKRCTHTAEWHSKKLSGGGHETDSGWCSCDNFMVKAKKVKDAN
jgi:hypothetical protein